MFNGRQIKKLKNEVYFLEKILTALLKYHELNYFTDENGKIIFIKKGK